MTVFFYDQNSKKIIGCYKQSAEEQKAESNKKIIAAVSAVFLVLSMVGSGYLSIHHVGPILHKFTIPLFLGAKIHLVLTVPLTIAVGVGVASSISLAVSIFSMRPTKIYSSQEEMDLLEKCKQSSPLRKLYELKSLPRNVVRTIRDYFSKPLPIPQKNESMSIENKSEIEEVEEGFSQINSKEDYNPRPYLAAANYQLAHQRMLKDSAIEEVCAKLIGERKDIVLVPNFFKNGMGSGVENSIKEEHRYILMPVVLEGPVNHIVAVMYDKKDNTLEFYDSKGLTIFDYTNQVTNNEKLNLVGAIHKLLEACDADIDHLTVIENTTKHQEDGYNCGVYVLNYFQQRLKGKDPEEIHLTYGETVEKRKEYINLINS